MTFLYSQVLHFAVEVKTSSMLGRRLKKGEPLPHAVITSAASEIISAALRHGPRPHLHLKMQQPPSHHDNPSSRKPHPLRPPSVTHRISVACVSPCSKPSRYG
jgi:hypothetical protein